MLRSQLAGMGMLTIKGILRIRICKKLRYGNTRWILLCKKYSKTFYSLHYEKFSDGSVKCIEEEIPFELPKGWSWARLNQIYNFIDYRGATPNKISSGVPLITAKNVKSGYIDYTVDEYISEKEYLDRQQRGISRLGDILFTTEAPLGNAAISNIEKFSAGQRLITFQHYGNCVLNNTTFLYFILSNFFQNQLHTKKTGSTVAGIKASILKTLLLPVPPAKEQETICYACGNILGLVEKIISDKQDVISIISKTKTKILDLAIRGQLVPQNPHDEPASVLLERIRAEKEKLIKQGKIKRDKKESIIFKGEDNSYYRNKKGKLICIDKELPYELPDGWTWAMLPEVVFFQEGPGILKKDFRENGVPLIRISGLQTEKVLLTGCDYLDEEMVKNKWEHFKLDLGDVLLCTSASIGKASIVGYEAVGAIPYTGQIRFKMSEAIIRDYFLYLATSSVYLDQVNKMKTGNCIQHYGPTHLKEVYVPLPPINEQEKIADKLRAIFSQFNSLENTLV